MHSGITEKLLPSSTHFIFFRHLTSNYSPKDTLNSGGGVHIVMYGRSGMTIDPRIPYNARTQHVGFSPTRQTLLAQSAKRRGVLSLIHI